MNEYKVKNIILTISYDYPVLNVWLFIELLIGKKIKNNTGKIINHTKFSLKPQTVTYIFSEDWSVSCNNWYIAHVARQSGGAVGACKTHKHNRYKAKNMWKLEV